MSPRIATRKTRKPRSAGRPPGTDSTRGDILRSAREAFGAAGYDGTSLRAVALRAGVDPSTVIHFFATKEGLFEAVVQEVAPAVEQLVQALERRATGVELVRIYLYIWDDERSSDPMRAVIRTSLTSSTAVRLLRDLLTRKILAAASHADPLGAELAIAQLIGIGLTRHVARLPGLAAADIETLAKRIGPILDHHLYSKGEAKS